MPTVPIIDASTVAPRVGEAQAFAAPGVEPMRNFQPEQGAKLGAATQAAGQTMMKIGEMIQDQIDDANTKAADSWYTSQAQKVLFDPQQGYLNSIGLAAKDGYIPTQEKLAKIREDASVVLTNDVQKRMFAAVAQKHEINFASQMDNHAVKQIRVYAAGESEARQTQYGDLAIADKQNRPSYLATSVSEAEARADLLELPKDSAQRKAMVQGAYQYVHVGVANEMITANDFTGAKAYVEKAFKDQQLDSKTYRTLANTIDTGYKKEVAVTAGDKIFDSNNAPASSDSQSVIDYVIKNNEIKPGQSEKVIRDGDGTTKFGINSKANKMTDAQVANLTLDQARNIYKKNYWDAIKADDLDPKIRAMAYDTAVNQGVPTAKRLLQESGGDPTKFAELRRENYKKIVEAQPDKAIYMKGWMNRVDRMEAISIGKTRSMSSMLQEAADAFPNDREQREMTQTRIKNRWSEDESVRTQDYQETFRKAQDIAFATEGGWKNVPPQLTSKLSPEDNFKLRNRPKTSDSDTLLELQLNPNLWAPGKIEQYRPMLSEADYRSFVAKGSGADGVGKILDATVDKDMLDSSLAKAGMENYVSPKGGNKQKRIDLNVRLENMIDVEQQRKGNKLSRQEKQRLIDDVIMDKVKVPHWYGDSTVKVIEAKDEDLKDAYVVLPGNKKFAISSISASQREIVVKNLLERGIPVTETNIATQWLQAKEAASKSSK
jgi:hypothetical protein